MSVAYERNCCRCVTDGSRSAKGVRVRVALKLASKCATKSVKLRLVSANKHLTPTLTRTSLTDQLKRSWWAKCSRWAKCCRSGIFQPMSGRKLAQFLCRTAHSISYDHRSLPTDFAEEPFFWRLPQNLWVDECCLRAELLPLRDRWK